MTGETPLTVVGNLTADPELRHTNGGLPVVNLTVASTPRTFDRQTNEWKDGTALFMRCSAWREFAENIAGSLRKGQRVVAVGRLTQRNYQDAEGNPRTSVELELESIGPDLRYATAAVTRNAPRNAAGGRPAASGEQYAPPSTGDAWSVPGEDTPF